MRMRRLRLDDLWAIPLSDLHFFEPPQVLGRGTFGMVVAAEFRKTRVAVKLVIPPTELNCLAVFSHGGGDSTIRAATGGSNDQIAVTLGTPQHRPSHSAATPKRGNLLRHVVLQHASGTEDKRLRKQFVEEMRTLSKLRHPCITTVSSGVETVALMWLPLTC